MFDRTGKEVYRSHELIDILVYIGTEEELKKQMYQAQTSTLFERLQNCFCTGDDVDLNSSLNILHDKKIKREWCLSKTTGGRQPSLKRV
jgi:hypothetical protein